MRASISDWLKLARIEHASMVLVAVIISEALTAKYAGMPFILDFRSIFPAFGPFFIAAGAFILNDYFGYGTDKANGRIERPLVAKKITRKDALRVSVFLFALGLFLAFFVNFYCFIVAFAFAFLSAVYDNFLKKKPLLGNAFISSSMAISFVYGNLAITHAMQGIILLFVAVSFLAGMGRELIITLRDVKGDRKIGAVTLPMLIGAKKTIRLAAAFFAVAIALSWIPIRTAVSPYTALISINNAMLLASIYFACIRGPNGFRKARNLSLFALMLGLLAFASLAV